MGQHRMVPRERRHAFVPRPTVKQPVSRDALVLVRCGELEVPERLDPLGAALPLRQGQELFGGEGLDVEERDHILIRRRGVAAGDIFLGAEPADGVLAAENIQAAHGHPPPPFGLMW